VLGGLAGILVAPVLFGRSRWGRRSALKAFAATIIGGFVRLSRVRLSLRSYALGSIETFGARLNVLFVPYNFNTSFLFGAFSFPGVPPAARHLSANGREKS